MISHFHSRDMVLVMTVEPGFGGQKFMESCLDKVAQIRALSSSIYIEVDGGVSVKNAELCASKGANVLVSGSAIFGASDIKQYIREMKNAIEKHLLCVCYYEELHDVIQVIKRNIKQQYTLIQFIKIIILLIRRI